MRHYEHLKTSRAQQSVYAQSSDSTIIAASIQEVIATLDGQITQVERQIRQHFDDHPELKPKRWLNAPPAALMADVSMVWLKSRDTTTVLPSYSGNPVALVAAGLAAPFVPALPAVDECELEQAVSVRDSGQRENQRRF